MKKKALKTKAKYLVRPLEFRPKDMNRLKERQTLRESHILGQNILAQKYERERISTMLNQNISPQLRATLLKNRDMLK